MADDQLRNALRAFILDNFLPGEAPESLDDSTLLITSGVVTSLALVELVAFIEDTFPVTLAEEDIGVSRMDSVDLLVDLVAERSGQESDRARR